MNLQSEGHGIENFATMLSIGLGQDQQFTLILQTLQQLKDVYGDSVDKIVQGNTSNIVFLKSTDDAMIDTLQKMSGTTHKVYKDSKTVTTDKEEIIFQNEAKVSYTMAVKEVPVISYNDMAYIPTNNSIVFRAGDSPIWNRNQTALPMSWKLFGNTIMQPGKEYTLQNIPTLSSAVDFDVRKNQPNFYAMFEERRKQASYASEAKEMYKKAYGYTDDDISRLDPDIYADEIMEIINSLIESRESEDNTNEEFGINDNDYGSYLDVIDNKPDNTDDDSSTYDESESFNTNSSSNASVGSSNGNKYEDNSVSIKDEPHRLYGGVIDLQHYINVLSDKNKRDDKPITINEILTPVLNAFNNNKGAFNNDNNCELRYCDRNERNGVILYNTKTNEDYIKILDDVEKKLFVNSAKDAKSKVFANGDSNDVAYQLSNDKVVYVSFLKYIAEHEDTLLNGEFKESLIKHYKNYKNNKS